jgi:pimeloyl-ACP methyl ester carboxylesterase
MLMGRGSHRVVAILLFALSGVAVDVGADAAHAIMDRYETVNGVRLHYLVAGKGAPVILLHGYAQNSHMWRPLMKELAKTHLVVAPDLRGFGDSAKPASGYDKKTMAQDVHALAKSLGIQKAGVAGHDIGLMVAYAYAAQYPSEVDRLALMDAFIPGVGDTTNLFLLKDLWHFHFYGPTPLALVKGRERVYFEHFWNDFAADGTKSVSEPDRRFYAQKYAQPGAMKAGMEVFRNFDQDAKDNAVFAATKLTMPVLVLGGEKSGGDFLIGQGKMVATNVEGVLVSGSGHWLIDEAPGQVIPKLVEFFGRLEGVLRRNKRVHRVFARIDSSCSLDHASRTRVGGARRRVPLFRQCLRGECDARRIAVQHLLRHVSQPRRESRARLHRRRCQQPRLSSRRAPGRSGDAAVRAAAEAERHRRHRSLPRRPLRRPAAATPTAAATFTERFRVASHARLRQRRRRQGERGNDGNLRKLRRRWPPPGLSSRTVKPMHSP